MPRVSPRFLIAAGSICCAALAIVSTAGAQEAVGFFERVDREVGLELNGRVESAAWADVDGDGDPDLLTVTDVGEVTLWRNRGIGGLDPLVVEQLQGTIRGARWFDADRDGDPDLLTYGAVEGDELIWLNTGGQLESPVSYGSGPALSQQVIDVDGDGLLDLYVGTSEGEAAARSGIVVRRGEGYATATIEGFLPGENQTLTTLYRARLDDALELYSGGATFPDHRFSFGAAGPRYLGGTNEGTTLVRDVLSGDFDGNLVSEMLLLRADEGAAIAISEDGTEIIFLISAADSVSSVTIGGAPRLDVEVIDQRGLPAFAIQFGAQRIQSDSYEFTLDGSETPSTNVVRGVDAGLFINAPDQDRFRFALAGTDEVSAQIRVTADVPIEVVQSVGLPSSGGAVFDQFYERHDDDWSRSQRLRSATECSAAAIGDFDNDMDLDVYMSCGNAIENTANRLFRNNGSGGFREAVLSGGELITMQGATGIAVADVDSDGFLDLVVQSSGGSGPAGRSALLAGVDNGNNWLGVELVGRESSPDAVGATLVLETGEVSQRRDLLGGVHTSSQDESRLHFGLGPNQVAERLTVRWPNGRLQVIDDIAANQYVQLQEPVADSPYADVRLVTLEVEPVARSGDRLEVFAEVRNIGTVASSEATLIFELPSGWSAVKGAADFTVEGSTVTWPLPAVPPTQGVNVTLAIEVEASSGRGVVDVSVAGDFPTNRMTAEVVTGDRVNARFGTAALLLALVAGAGVLGGAIWLVTRRR